MFAELNGQPAESVIDRLGLQPLPAEGGFWKPGPRTPNLNSITFLMTPAGFSAMHLLTVAEGWQWLAGAACEMLQLRPDGSQVVLELGPAWPATIVSPGVWQGARTKADWSLVSCWCAPAYTDEAFTLGEPAALTRAFPTAARLIKELSR